MCVCGRRQPVLPSDMLLRMCRKHMRRFLISSLSSLSQRSTALPSADAHWFWRREAGLKKEHSFIIGESESCTDREHHSSQTTSKKIDVKEE